MALHRFQGFLASVPKWRLFALLVALTAAAATLASVVTHVAVLEGSRAEPLRLALIAPMSGPDAGIGQAMRAGVEQWLEEARQRRNRPAGRHLELVVVDEAREPDGAARIARDDSVVAVIGPFADAAAARAQPVLAQAGLPTLMLAAAAGEGGAPAPFELASRPEAEIRFLANYVRNVLGERLVSIILPQDETAPRLAAAFDEVLQRFGTRVVYRWAAAPEPGPAQDDALRQAAAEIGERKVAGTILVLGPQDFAARAVAALRGAAVPNRVVGTRVLATNAFRQSLRAILPAHGAVEAALNGTVATVPALFDTAGAAAQRVRDRILASTGQPMDWTAALAYDAAALLGADIAILPEARTAAAAVLRTPLQRMLATRSDPSRAWAGLAGSVFFMPGAGGSLPELVGTYDGRDIVAAPTQLSPIREKGIANYLEELSAGRALYVNDRFMYRTNVVYAGVQLEKVFSLDPAANIAELEFMVWFRWRGGFEPQDVVFPNALDPVRLGTPEREALSGDLSYRAWRVRGRFYMNRSPEPHRYGTHIIDVTFRHRTLSRANLLYVTDILGMGLTATGGEAHAGWLQHLLGTQAGVGSLTRQLQASQILVGVPGWLVERAWLSQEIGQASSAGDPVYVGFGKPAPAFSTIGLGVVVKPDSFDPAAMLPQDWYIYIAIFAASMALLAALLDRRDRGHFWRMQTLLLRILSWPVLLAALSSLALDHAQDQLTPSGVAVVSMASGMLWWLVPAQLLLISMRRFVWVPLEAGTGRKVPTVFIMIVDLLIYLLAGFGIVAFVLGKTITSLLAGSGVLAMIVGLALQSNLKDIFSGIMLNLERPFVLNDMLRLNRTFARVVDVSWRSTRLETDTGSIIALPNSKVSEAEIENLSSQRVFEVMSSVALDPSHPPEIVVAALREAGSSYDFPVKIASAALSKIERMGEAFVATYTLGLETSEFRHVKVIRGTIMERVWHSLTRAGIAWTKPAREPHGPGA